MFSVLLFEVQKEKMFWFFGVLFAVLSFQVDTVCSDPSRFCPEYSAVFVSATDQVLDGPTVTASDPEFTFFKEELGFREDDIQHARDDAFKFFNDTYGLDFSLSSPNEDNEYFFENAKLRSIIYPHPDIYQSVVVNNWINTGSTRLTCHNIRDGQFHVSFTGDQLLHGSYGGVDGLPADHNTFLVYGYAKINVCNQSPVIIQRQTSVPPRFQSIGESTQYVIDFDLYSRVLGYGKALGVDTLRPDPDNPGKYHFVDKRVYTFGN